ncbi:hypothetical protein GGS23DRAFT_214438 [Durotheca rogersii]|uniref:uncharacterized protein n=1 Tax=Durotheca rogersii TaxID=419775 RepID=UPI0022203F3C|nr:uncharacterized protein GGS23DRAFT_214438 [Durotheca rogersii]KAI5860862.1 hypothetical protein GGS23DRAFT_214438 [Durotheca rogersii]
MSAFIRHPPSASTGLSSIRRRLTSGGSVQAPWRPPFVFSLSLDSWASLPLACGGCFASFWFSHSLSSLSAPYSAGQSTPGVVDGLAVVPFVPFFLFSFILPFPTCFNFRDFDSSSSILSCLRHLSIYLGISFSPSARSAVCLFPESGLVLRKHNLLFTRQDKSLRRFHAAGTRECLSIPRGTEIDLSRAAVSET